VALPRHANGSELCHYVMQFRFTI